jgi:hypothetical protein
MFVKRLLTLSIFAFACHPAAKAQELYNITEPASTLPKHTLGIRLSNEMYSEEGMYRKITTAKVMYGLARNLMVFASFTGSDYHSRNLPFDFIQHNHSGGVTTAVANKPAVVPYPFIFDGIDLYAQYRIYSSDAQNSHFRMALYAEGSKVYITSHLAEPELLAHNSGIGGGVIGTYLKSHFAGTVTLGYIKPFTFNGNSYDIYGGVYPTTYKYGNAFAYDLSLGYLLFPRHYKNYDQTNLNVYLEFLGKSYGGASVRETDGSVTLNVPTTADFLKASSYVEVYPGVQAIIKSNVRIDLSAGLPLIGRSYIHNYPLFYIAVQRYFYFNKPHHDEKT